MSGRRRPSLRSQDIQARQQFVSDVFHAISQPLTSLRCCIELALMQEGTVESYRDALAEALTHAERVNRSAEFVRLMAEAEDPGNPCQTELSSCIAAAAAEFAPVFEAQGRSVTAQCECQVQVVADPEKLSRALFLVLDFCAAEGGDVVLALKRGRKLQIWYGPRSADNGAALNARAQQSLDLAKRMLTATGAKIEPLKKLGERGLSVTWPGTRAPYRRSRPATLAS